jgi:hypothetical protein
MRRRGAAVLAAAIAVVAAFLFLRSAPDRDAVPPRAPDDAATTAGALAVDAHGRAYAAIERLEGGRWRSVLARERGDGSLDTRFAYLPLESPAGVAAAGDGTLLVAGDRVVAGRRELAVARVRPDGRVDGVASFAAGTGGAVARGIAAVPGGGYVVVGDARDQGRSVIAAVRVDRGGRPRVDLIPGASAAGVAIDPAGRPLIAGTAADGAAVLARPGGDATRVPTGLTSATWRAVAATADGGAVVVGSGRGAGARSLIAVLRVDRSGALAGHREIAAGEGDAHGSGVAVEADGGVLVGGTAVERDRPVAVVASLGSPDPPARRAAGRLVGLARGSLALTTTWDGERQRASLAR